MATHRTSITIGEADRGEREILRIHDRGKGEAALIIPALSSNFERPRPYADKQYMEKTKVFENRWSIHPSPRSEKGINMLKKTTRTAEMEEADELLLFTDAIKKKSGFQPMFNRRHPRMTQAVFNPMENPNRSISIGSYNPDRLQLITAVFVSHKDVVFPEEIVADSMSITSITAAEYRFVLLATFLQFPAYQGTFADVSTEDMGKDYEGPFGHASSALTCIDLMRGAQVLAAKTAYANHPDVENNPFFANRLKFPKFCKFYEGYGELSNLVE